MVAELVRVAEPGAVLGVTCPASVMRRIAIPALRWATVVTSAAHRPRLRHAGYIPPTDTLPHTAEERRIAGLTFVFQMAPDTEAPEEFHFYIPELKA